MAYTTSPKPLRTLVCLLLFATFLNPAFACEGTGIDNATSTFIPTSNETSVEIEFCIGVTDLFGLPSDFKFTFEGVSTTPTITASANRLSATYNFNEDATNSIFFCNCNDNGAIPPTISANTDTWTANPGTGELLYTVARSNNRLNHECQIDCVNGQPLEATGGAINYMTSISTCYVITAMFPGDIESELSGVSLTGAENSVCDDEEGMSFGLSASLPVELGSFEGEFGENSVTLDWITLSEDNVYKYTIERSANGLSDFEAIGIVGVTNNNQSTKKYTFQDRAPLSKGFYRLKTVDIDESFSYSRVIFVESSIKDLNVTNVNPNPTEGQTEIIYETKANASVHFKVFDINGALKADRILEAVNGFNKIDFDFSELREGMYFIVLESGTEKIVKRIAKF